jgi:hypothetical protein
VQSAYEEWPPKRDLFNNISQNIGQRCHDVLVYCDKKFPFTPPAVGEWPNQFLDFSKSLTRLVGTGGDTNPWMDSCPTFTATSQIAIRWGVKLDGGVSSLESSAAEDPFAIGNAPAFRVVLRQLDGLELMQFIGFPFTAYREGFPTHAQATSLAGNAFSAFAVGPCLLAAITVMRMGVRGAAVDGSEPECVDSD